MRKLLIGLVVTTLLLSSASAGLAVSNNPIIEKLTFVHYAKPSDQSKPIWDDQVGDFRLIAGGIKWFETISYEVNPSGSSLAPETVQLNFEASSETWDLETPFDLFAVPTITLYSYIGHDGTNRIIWKLLSPGVIAVIYLWYIPKAKEIVEFDMIFNTYYPWSISGEPGKMDLRNIATHEFGHNGLDDLRSPRAQCLTMYAFSSLGETFKRTLGTGDRLGIQKLYGGY